MARNRDDDYEDDDDDRPRRRRRDDDEDDDDDRGRRPRRRGSEPLTGMDGLFANTNIVVLILFSCLCSGIAFILGIIGLVTCKDATAKNNAMITTIVAGIITVLGIVFQVIAAVAR